MPIFTILSKYCRFYNIFQSISRIRKKNKADSSAGFIYLFIILNRFIEDINLFINARCILWILFQQFHFFA